MHIGHLRNISIGESISRLLEFQGVEVFRVTYGGDIGPHVAKAIWGVKKLGEDYEKVKKQSLKEKAEFLGKAYVFGAQKYEEDPTAKTEIDEINKKLYQRDPELVPLWEETKKISIAYFDSLYSRLGTEFDAQIWESEVEVEGKKTAEEYLNKVFVRDQGAIIFPGEKYRLHTRVFVTSAGYPTYEAKELGLTLKEESLFPFDYSLHVVANEQTGYFQVVIKASELIEESRTGKKKHLPYGMVNLTTGKMSSRKGGVITADELINQVNQAVKDEKLAIAAIKFWFLKYSLTSDIAFDVEKSVSLQGDSGPYVMYAYTRIRSVLGKASKQGAADNGQLKLEAEERELLRLIEYFELIAEQAAVNYQPSLMTDYLLNLAKAFNSFYERFPILHSEKESFRLKLTEVVGERLKAGLYLLGIETVEKM